MAGSEQTNNDSQFDCHTRRNARSLHICAIPLTFPGVRARLPERFQTPVRVRKSCRARKGRGIERLGLEEWRRMPGRREKKIDGHVKFAPSKQSDFRV